jgi:hypothetical protein
METAMDDRSERLSINMSAIPVAGIGGLGMLALVVIMAIAFPVARWLLFGGLAGGLLVAWRSSLAGGSIGSARHEAIRRRACSLRA